MALEHTLLMRLLFKRIGLITSEATRVTIISGRVKQADSPLNLSLIPHDVRSCQLLGFGK